MLTGKQLVLIAPRCPYPDSYAELLGDAMLAGNIVRLTPAAMFLGQLCHESGEFRLLEEIADGSQYEGRRNLGNTEYGDGPRYKGRGFIQLTGRHNYRTAGEALGIDLEGRPQDAADPRIASRVAVWFWNMRGLPELADALDFGEVTRRINGGMSGFEERRKYYHKALEILGLGVTL